LSEALKLTDYKSSNVLHRSIKSPPFSEEIFEIVLEKVKRLLNVEGVIDMMNHQNFIDETPFGFAMTGRTFIKSLNALKETLSDSDLKRALAKNLDDLIILVLKS
jgi:SOS response regulatory protein OraA/RecX